MVVIGGFPSNFQIFLRRAPPAGKQSVYGFIINQGGSGRKAVKSPFSVHTTSVSPSGRKGGEQHMKIGSFIGGAVIGAAAGMAADMLLRPKAHPKTPAGKAAQSVSDAMEQVAGTVQHYMK